MNVVVKTVLSCLALHFFATCTFAQATTKAADAGASSSQKVAVVNIVDLFDHLKEKIAADNEMAALKQKADTAMVSLQNNLRNLQVRLRTLDENDPEHKQVQDELAAASVTMKNATEIAQAQFALEMRVRTIALYKKINDAVTAFAEANNFDLVLVADELRLNNGASQDQLQMIIATRKVLYSRKTVDITHEIEQRMNADYDTARNGQP